MADQAGVSEVSDNYVDDVFSEWFGKDEKPFDPSLRVEPPAPPAQPEIPPVPMQENAADPLFDEWGLGTSVEYAKRTGLEGAPASPSSSFLQSLSSMPDPAYELSRLRDAEMIAKALHMPIQEVAGNLDSIAEAWMGKVTPPARFAQVIGDHWYNGEIQNTMGEVANQLRGAQTPEQYQALLARMQELEGSMRPVQDVPRVFVAKWLEGAAQSAPMMAHSMLEGGITGMLSAGAGAAALSPAASAAAPLTGGLSIPALVVAMGSVGMVAGSTEQMRRTLGGLSYWDMVKKGIPHEIAAPVSHIDGLVQAALESIGDFWLLGAKIPGINTLVKSVGSKVSETILLNGVVSQMAAKWAAGAVVGGIGEGFENGAQELATIVKDQFALELSRARGARPEMTDAQASELVSAFGKAFMEGFGPGVIFAGAFSVPGVRVRVQEAVELRDSARAIPKRELFIQKEMAAKPEGTMVSDERWAEYLGKVWDSQSSSRAKVGAVKTPAPTGAEPGAPLAMPAPDPGAAAPVSAPEEGMRRSVISRTAQGTREVMAFGTPEARTGYVTTITTGSSVYIDNVVNEATDADLTKERILRVARENPGKTIEWNPDTEAMVAVKEELLQEYPRLFDTVGAERSGTMTAKAFEEAATRAIVEKDDQAVKTLSALGMAIAGTRGETADQFFSQVFRGIEIRTMEQMNRTRRPEEVLAHGAINAGVEFYDAEGNVVDQGQVSTLSREQLSQVRALLVATEGTDLPTLTHEFFHAVEALYLDDRQIASFESALNKKRETWTRADKEFLADNFEVYLKTGESPVKELESIFQKFAEMLQKYIEEWQAIARRYMGKGLTPELKAAYDSLLTTSSAMQDAEDVQAPEPSPAPEPAAEPSEVIEEPVISDVEIREIPISKIVLSREVPNFKEGANASGVVEPIKAGRYERIGTAPIVIWERLNGDLEVITGRHRLDLARRLGETTIPAQVVKEAEGWTAAKAMTFDAESNIRSEKGTVKDYANYFRNSDISQEEAYSRGLLARDKGRKGWAIGKYAENELYTLFRNKEIGETRAAAIAEAAPNDQGSQAVGIRAAGKMKADELGNYVRAVRQMKGGSSEAEQMDMFGRDDSAVREAEAVAREATSIQREIANELSALNGALRLGRGERAKILSQYGFKAGDEASIRSRISVLESRAVEWENWATTPSKYQELRKRAGLPYKQEIIDEAAAVAIDTSDAATLNLFHFQETGPVAKMGERKNYSKNYSDDIAPPVQPVNDLDSLIELATQEYPWFLGWCADLAEKYGATVMEAPDEFRPRGPNGAKIKAKERILGRKVDATHGPETVLDIAGITLMFDNIDQITSLLENESQNDAMARIKDRLAVPALGGYRDVLINVKTPAGAIMELQLNVEQAMIAKESVGHVLYEAMDQIKTAIESGRIAHPEASTLFDYIIGTSQNLYNEAFDAALSGRAFSISDLDIATPLSTISERSIEFGNGTSVLSDMTSKRLKSSLEMATSRSSQSANRSELSLKSIEPSGFNIARSQEERKSLWHTAPINSENFEKWFKKSKVVDENGNPQVVYHGGRGGITQFDPGLVKSRNEGPGTYFTTSKKVARGYQTDGSGARGLYEVYLSIQNPLRYDAKPFSKSKMSALLEEIAKKEDREDWRDGFLSNFVDTYSLNIKQAAAEAATFFADEEAALDQISGIVGAGVDPDVVNGAVRDVLGYDGYYSEGFSNIGDKENTIWVAMFPEQIKSTGNVGTWGVDDPRILYHTEEASSEEMLNALSSLAAPYGTAEEFISAMEQRPGSETLTKDQRAVYENLWVRAHPSKTSETMKDSGAMIPLPELDEEYDHDEKLKAGSEAGSQDVAVQMATGEFSVASLEARISESAGIIQDSRDKITVLEKEVESLQAELGEAYTSAEEWKAYAEKVQDQKTRQKARLIAQKWAKVEELKAEFRQKEADRRAAVKYKAAVNRVIKKIMAPPSVSISYRGYAEEINRIQRGLDPAHHKTAAGNPTKWEKERQASREFFAKNPDAAALVDQKKLDKIYSTSLSDMPLAELEELLETVDGIRKLGKMKRSLQLQQRLRSRKQAQVVLATTVLRGEPPQEVVGRASKSPELFTAWLKTLKTDRIVRLLDGVFTGTNEPGEFSRQLWDRVNQEWETEQKAYHARMDPIVKRMDELKLTADPWKIAPGYTYLGEEISVPYQGQTFRMSDGHKPTLEQAMYWYIGMQNERTAQALRFGNKIPEEVLQAGRDLVAQNQNLREFCDMIEKDGTENFQRLREAFIDLNNFDLPAEEHYVRMRRMKISYESRDDEVTAELTNRTGTMQKFVAANPTFKRIDVPEEFQSPIDDRLLSTWMQGVKIQEAYINKSQMVRDLQNIFGSDQVTKAVQQKFGPAMNEWIKNYINYIAAGEEYSRNQGWEKLSRIMRSNASIAWLSFNVLTAAKQLTSTLDGLAEAGPVHLLGASLQFLSNPAKMIREVEEKSVTVRHRQATRELEDLKRLDSNKYELLVKKIGTAGMAALAMEDKAAATIVWRAVYDKAISDGADEAGARKAADEGIVRSQPSVRPQDMAEIYRSGEVAKWFTMMTSDLSAKWNRLSFDVPAALVNRQIGYATMNLISISLSGLAIAAMSGAFSGDDEEEKKKALVFSLFSQHLEALPLVGNDFSSAIQRSIGIGNRFASSGVKLIPAMTYLERIPSQFVRKDWGRMAENLAEGVGMTVGLPVSGPRRAIKTAITGDWTQLLGWPAEEGKQ